jgi:hypothetical protein
MTRTRVALLAVVLIAVAVVLQSIIRPSVINPGRVRLQHPIETTSSVNATRTPAPTSVP